MLPVPLFHDKDTASKFVMLNGNRGNFCLDLSDGQKATEMRSSAWSADVGHYVVLSEGFADVHRWDSTTSARQRFQISAVEDEPERFHNFLSQAQPNRELSIVTRLMRTFRSLRTALGPHVDGPTSLQSFLYLLACAKEGVDRGQLKLDSWQLSPMAAEVSSGVRDDEWSAIYRDATDRDPRLGISARFDLVLNHASGQLFQEAHYQSVFLASDQLSLGGFSPRPIKLIPKTIGVGLHFTPPSIARTLVEEALSIFFLENHGFADSITIFDPACGSGEFLKESLRQLKLCSFTGKIVLIGWDISPAACDTAQFVLAWERRDAIGHVEIDIQNANSMKRNDWPKTVDILLMNPPYQAWEDMQAEDREIVSKTLGSLARNKPDLAAAFLLRAARTLGSGKILGSVMPASIFDSSSARPLRAELADSMVPRLMARLGSQTLFGNATVDVGLYLAIAGGDRSKSPLAFWADYRADSASSGLRELRKIRGGDVGIEWPVETSAFSIYVNKDLGSDLDTWAPRPYRSWKLLNATSGFPRVSDFFNVRQGIRTGANEVFLISAETFNEMHQRERRFFRPAVVNESIRKNVLSMSAYVFFPYGSNSIESEAELRKYLGNFYLSTLEKAKPKLEKRAGINPDRWWELTRHRGWQIKEEPKLVSTYFGDSGSFAVDDSGSSVVVQGFAWIPKKRILGFSGVTEDLSYAYLTILRSPQFLTLIAATSNHVGGGQWNLSKKFMDLLPLPDLISPTISPDIFRSLVEIGWKLAHGNLIDETNAKSLVNSVFGLSE
jgi:adenine-specific DNA-methyltransferase